MKKHYNLRGWLCVLFILMMFAFMLSAFFAPVEKWAKILLGVLSGLSLLSALLVVPKSSRSTSLISYDKNKYPDVGNTYKSKEKKPFISKEEWEEMEDEDEEIEIMEESDDQ